MTNKALLLASLVLAGLGAGFAQSDTVYVAYNGLDTHPCTRPAPCQTITHALSVVNAGGQVSIIGSGTYDIFTIVKAVTVAAEPGIIATLDVPSSGTGVTINAGASDRVVIRGLYLIGHGSEFGIVMNSAGEVSIEDCVARNFYQAIATNPTVASFITIKGGVYSDAPGAGVAVQVQVHQRKAGAQPMIPDRHCCDYHVRIRICHDRTELESK